MEEEHKEFVPPVMTVPCLIYQGERFNLLMFFLLTTQQMPKQLDDFVKMMANSMEEENIDPMFREQWEIHRRHGFGAQQGMLVYETLAAEMFVVRYVSTFLAYLAELLALVFRAKPDMLSENTVTMKQVLEFQTPEALVALVAERKVNDISDKGMKSLNDHFKNNYKLTLFQDEAEMQEAEYIRAVRNLIVHKRGMVDHKFLADVPERRGHDTVGAKVHLDRIFEKFALFDRIVNRIDEAVATKYVLDRTLTAQDFWHAMVQLRQQTTPVSVPSPSDDF